MKRQHAIQCAVLTLVTAVGATTIVVTDIDAQVRTARRTTTSKQGEATVAAGPRGVAVKGEEGYATASRRGVTASGDEGYAAVGRRGAVAAGEEGAAAVSRRGAVVVGEEGAAAVGRYGGVRVGESYESYEAWRRVAGVTAGIAIGTMLAKPPAQATTIVVTNSTYYYQDNAYYTRVMVGGEVKYQVVEPPAGAIIATLPAGCKSVKSGAVTYSQCGSTYYQRVDNGYQVVILQ